MQEDMDDHFNDNILDTNKKSKMDWKITLV